MDEIKVKVSIPDGFHIMDSAEKNALGQGGTIPDWCISNPEEHIIFSVSRKNAPKLAAFLVNAKDMAKKMRKESAAIAVGYRFGDIREFSIDGEKAYGYSLSYDAKGISMCGESLVVKKGNAFCYFHSYYREELKDESIRILEEIYNSVRL